MKLEVGMFLRTKYGEIHRIKSIDNEYIEYENGFGVSYELKECIKKASFNIIDLICVGDYVNGLMVIRISEDTETNEKYINLCGSISEWEQDDIVSIVTKEQFKKICYKLR